MTWVELWREVVGEDPIDPTSREVTVQDRLAELIVGRRPLWFEECQTTAGGRGLLTQLWEVAFGGAARGEFDWFVSEYALPVPPEWREEIKLTYGCPDFACRCGDSILIVELKTEARSYRHRQMLDYARLARRLHPDAMIDLVLLGPLQPGYRPECDHRQRYVELTWMEMPRLIRTAFAGDSRAAALAQFIATSLASAPSAAAVDTAHAGETAPTDDLALSAIAHARRMAPSVIRARRGDRIERGIDIRLPSDEVARMVQAEVKRALEGDGCADRVSVWLWKPSSRGVPSTPAGQDLGRELRLAPRFSDGDG